MSYYNEQPLAPQKKQSILLPLAIIIAGLSIAAAIFFNRAAPLPKGLTVDDARQTIAQAFVPVSKGDHVRGDLDKASIVIVDYSDTECPYCKVFHETLKQIYSEYESSGKIAWVYRHFPLSIHPKAIKQAEAAECVAEIGGEDAFWDFISEIYEKTTSNNTLEESRLYEFAKNAGVNEKTFTTCLTSGKYSEKVKQSYENSLALAGGEITPFTVLVVNGNVIPMVDSEGQGLGAFRYNTFKALIEQLLNS